MIHFLTENDDCQPGFDPAGRTGVPGQVPDQKLST